jgi:2'-5' RNA ligase
VRRDETIRAFFAVDLDAAAREAASAVANALRALPGGEAVGWVRPENLHVTLRFLGDIDASRIDPLVDAVDESLSPAGQDRVGSTPFETILAAPRLFPSPRRPRVVILDVAPEAPWVALAEAVEGAVVTAGFAPEARRFRPHLTLGRIRGREFPAVDAAPAPQASWEVREAVLFRSDLHSSGVRYTPLAQFPFGSDRSRRAQRAEETTHPNR